MWSSKDISCIVMLSVVGLVATALVAQMAGLISGIRGSNYIFTIILAIVTGLSLLMYEGRRWRFFAQTALFAILIIPTYLSGPPFSVQSKIHFFITGFVADAVVNSFYCAFRKREKLKYWSIFGALLFWGMLPLFSLLIRPFFYPPEAVALFANVVLVLLPVIIVEAIAGGYLGYRIYVRLKKDRVN